ncbi:alpha-latrocrustotoxin-Lt1a-like [Cotesia glomerata]|uniref:alpha-latrocrustotoxin-Lt1a-like n=1 Tax=Cotesia glomerata TaxID=32391 RepID=UPI001D024717|nr:alpha-latrocrustotoxin-Lt1a-like [Cotesia glomerata]
MIQGSNANFKVMDTSTLISHSANHDANNLFYHAIKTLNWGVIKKYLKNGADINGSLVSSGPQAGYTALHLACMEKHQYKALKLLQMFSPDVNVVADDGTQPIHIACLFRNEKIFCKLLDAGANVEAELTQDHLKNFKYFVWSDDFNGKMTLLTFAVLNDRFEYIETLLKHNANIKVTSTNKKTLSMYAVEHNSFCSFNFIMSKLNDRELINARDNNDKHVVLHYILDADKYGGFRFDEKQQWHKDDHLHALDALIHASVDIHATVKGDRSTLFINVAAYRGCYEIVQLLQAYYAFAGKSRNLFYATRLVEDLDKYFRKHKNLFGNNYSRDKIDSQRQSNLESILTELVSRCTFGLPALKKEKKVMKRLMVKNCEIINVVCNHVIYFIHGTLKKTIITFGNQSMTLYDLAVKVFNKKTLLRLVRNENFIIAFKDVYEKMKSYGIRNEEFLVMLALRIEKGQIRIELLKKVKEIAQLTEAIPLPYEIILEIIEFLENENLEILINAFDAQFQSLQQSYTSFLLKN